MRKYILFVSLCLFFSGFFLFQNVQRASADVDAGGACTHDQRNKPKPCTYNPYVGGSCPPVQVCKDGLFCENKKCINPSSSEQTPCTCTNPGVKGEGKNGFKCGKDDATRASAPEVFCSNSDDACYPAGEEVVNFSVKKNNTNDYSGQTLKGVLCQSPKRVTAECSCVSTGTGDKGKFQCNAKLQDGAPLDEYPKDGKPDTAVGTCKNDTQACITDAGAFMNTDLAENYTGFLEPATFKNLFGADTGARIKGVRCDEPPTVCVCKNPGQNGSRINGFRCERTVDNVKVRDTDYCQRPIEACIPKPSGYVMTKKTANGIFKDAPLSGIDCVEVSPIPPPQPPCAGGFDADGRCQSFQTAFGPIETNAGAFITKLFALLLSASGGIALLLIMKAGYQIMVAGGKPDQINAGREQLVAAIVGLLFIIFSFVILQVIGIDILRLPGFAASGSNPTTGSPGTQGTLGGACDAGSSSSCQPGLRCVSTGGGRNGTCQ